MQRKTVKSQEVVELFFPVCVEMLCLFGILKKGAFLDYSWERADGAVAGLQLLGCKFQATNDFQ